MQNLWLPLLCAVSASLGIGLGRGLEPRSTQEPAALEPAPQEEENPAELPVGWREQRIQRETELRQALLGTWRLIEFRHIQEDLTAAPLAGLMLIDEALLVFIVHASPPQPSAFGDPRLFQGGVHHWRLSEGQILQTSSILSHTNFSNELVFEPQFTPREYEPALEGDQLSLVRSDGSTLLFQRETRVEFPERALQILEAARAGAPVDDLR